MTDYVYESDDDLYYPSLGVRPVRGDCVPADALPDARWAVCPPDGGCAPVAPDVTPLPVEALTDPVETPPEPLEAPSDPAIPPTPDL